MIEAPTIAPVEPSAAIASASRTAAAESRDVASVWREYFHHWPQGLPTVGVLVTREEQIPFEAFMVSRDMLLVERRTPDTQGARKVLVPFELIVALKIVDVVRGKLFESAGFKGTTERKGS